MRRITALPQRERCNGMTDRTGRDIIHRWQGNPLISVQSLSFRIADIRNATITEFDGEVVMLITMESLQGYSLIYKAHSDDGVNFSVHPEPLMSLPQDGPRALYEGNGQRDPRITRLDDTYYITYVADGERGLRLGLATTDDFKTVEFKGYITQPDVKNGLLFPQKIDGRYALLKRPAGGDIWISYSEDLEFWGDERVVMTKRGGYWDASRIGGSAVPILIEKGWLLIYYGIKETSAGPLCRLGAAILDRDDPSKVIARSNIPILSPRERYERIGDVPNVVFSCGAILRDEDVWIYYGGSDSCICLGSAPLQSITEFCIASAVVEKFLADEADRAAKEQVEEQREEQKRKTRQRQRKAASKPQAGKSEPQKQKATRRERQKRQHKVDEPEKRTPPGEEA
jgi:predicted GH43/DUF377 family glycosyl hydrolase